MSTNPPPAVDANEHAEETVVVTEKPEVTIRVSRSSKAKLWAIVAAIVIWFGLGIAALITSFVCLGRSGTAGQHVGGVFLSLCLGPFYWILFFSSKSYCKKLPSRMV